MPFSKCESKLCAGKIIDSVITVCLTAVKGKITVVLRCTLITGGGRLMGKQSNKSGCLGNGRIVLNEMCEWTTNVFFQKNRRNVLYQKKMFQKDYLDYINSTSFF